MKRAGLLPLLLLALLVLQPSAVFATPPADDGEDDDRQWPAEVADEQAMLANLPAPGAAELANRTAARIADEVEGLPEQMVVPGWKWRWAREPAGKKTGSDPAWLTELLKIIEQISSALGLLGHLVLWLALLLLLLALWRYRRQLVALWPRRRDPETFLAGVNIGALLEPEALPDDVVAGARQLWQAGHRREALSLLYRAALHRLGLRLAFAIPDSGTEGECLALVNRHADRDTGRAFRVLVDGWSRLAWQHRAPEQFEPLVDAYRRAAAGADAGDRAP